MKSTIFLALGTTLFLACNDKPAETTEAAKDSTVAAKPATPPPQAEIADSKYMEMGKKALAQFSSGDIDSWADGYADNAIFRWSAGDSLAGKKAIIEYWKNRRAKVIDSLQIADIVVLPVKVNTSQARGDVPGIWELAWYQTNVKYRNGKRVMFYSHMLWHYDANDKVDQSILFIDRAPINKALGVK